MEVHPEWIFRIVWLPARRQEPSGGVLGSRAELRQRKNIFLTNPRSLQRKTPQGLRLFSPAPSVTPSACAGPQLIGGRYGAADPRDGGGGGQKGPRLRSCPGALHPTGSHRCSQTPPAAEPVASFFISVEELTSITVLTSLDAATTGNTAPLARLCPRRRKRWGT